jgi:hypothetical protein
MIRTVQIYVENRRLDLFNDEQITVNSSVQNISDISKVFTDISQSFTIPCTTANNYVFEYYFNNDVDNTIDHNRRREARIEIDYTPFRTGKIQIERSQIKDGNPDNYQVTFFGDVVTFKDLVGEDKLSQLNHGSLDHSYSGAEVQLRIETDPASTDYDVKYPLITSERVWQYGSADARDISVNTAPIDYTELFPAVRVKSILDMIATDYGITFTGVHLETKQFNNLYLWYKNKERFTYYSPPKTLRFAIGNPSTDFIYESTVQMMSVNPATLLTGTYDVANNITHKCFVEISTASSIDYLLDVYKNGQYYMSHNGNGTQTFFIAQRGNISGMDVYEFRLRSTAAMTFSGTITYDLTYTLVEFSPASTLVQTDTYTETTTTSLTTVVNTDLATLAPDMKIVDFVSGLFNVQNLTAYGENSTTFRIEPLETFYNNGKQYDITQYLTTDEMMIDRPKLFNKISFMWEKSDSFMNREFFDLFKREYGDLEEYFGYDGGDFEIKLPFSSLLHSKFTGQNLQVGYCLGTEPEYKPYIPKPVLLYANDFQSTSVDFYFDNGTTVDQITDYVPFGHDLKYVNEDYSLAWGSEISSYTETIAVNSLYNVYYQPYLMNLYNGKTRLLTCKAVLPLRLLTDLRLNDTIIIRDKKWLINDMNLNLTNGEVTFNLVSNWRNGDTANYGQVYTADNSAQDIDVPFSVPSGVSVTLALLTGSGFSSVSDTTPTGQQMITFTLTANGTALDRTDVWSITVVDEVGTRVDTLTITQLA